MPPKAVSISITAAAADHAGSGNQSSANLTAETPSNTTTLASPQTAGAADREGSPKDKEKVPRPPNAFIIYRQEWHPKVVEQHPDMHNNDICKL